MVPPSPCDLFNWHYIAATVLSTSYVIYAVTFGSNIDKFVSLLAIFFVVLMVGRAYVINKKDTSNKRTIGTRTIILQSIVYSVLYESGAPYSFVTTKATNQL